ncbi:hypothetical protein DV096_19135 [Bradymonadaceae bacterium TMQ3]|uniref:Secreted protein n=1 Tax=Lujinxingia sediminis TaxID=2480984 RepID=A0ABY0CPZ6_9DELT|nr:hypothetical protein [Lujinxingia sediminis]RDV36568.1 hypothetical protein DV096_19135 [Bradymonadaceae bacterium TMQ3]RVU42419.1 hypothetical protein EA187_16200 [Lujinxingia sediminis]TXC74618.1 hypothetical protein FRC91_16020 [Bradymonadales bacterium TMQ1]
MNARTLSGLRSAAVALIALLGTTALLAGPSATSAEAQRVQRHSDRTVRLTLVVESPDIEAEPDDTRRTRARRLLAEEASKRILTRLKAIGVKDPRAIVTPQNHIQVVAPGALSAQVVRGALLAPGKLEIRPVAERSPHWTELAGQLPEGVEIRQNPGQVSPDRVHLWSADFATLHRFTRRLALGETRVEVFPTREGWRTLDLGEVLATEENLASSELRSSPAGIPFVQIELEPGSAETLRGAASSHTSTTLAVMLDGEVVSLIHRTGGQALEIPCPDHLRSHQSRQAWAAQVAGRLATPIPLTIAELTEP